MRTGIGVWSRVLIVGVLATPWAAGAGVIDAEGPVDAASMLGIVYLEGAPETRSTFALEGEGFAVTLYSMERVKASVPGVLARTVDASPRTASSTFGAGSGSGETRSDDVVLAAYPTAGAGSVVYAYSGPDGGRFTAEEPREIGPADGAWATKPNLAFRFRFPGDHVAFSANAGAHEIVGNFTVYLWDVDFHLGDAVQRQTFQTGIAPTTLALEERWVWARVQVTQGRLTIFGDSPVAVHASAIDVTTHRDNLVLASGESAGLGRGTFRVTNDHGEVSALAISTQGSTVSIVTARPSSLVLPFAALAAVFAVAAAFVVLRRRKAPARPVQPSARAFLLRARQAASEKDFSRAVQWIDCALTIEPTLAVAHLTRGLCLEGLERFEDAAKAYARAASGKDADGLAFYHHARSLVWMGRAHDALPRLQLAIAKEPALATKARADETFAALADHPLFHAVTGRLGAQQ